MSEGSVVPLIPVNSGTQFAGNIYLMRRDNPKKSNFYLIIQKLEKSTNSAIITTSKGMGGSYQVGAFAWMKLHNEDESLNYGDFELPLYPPPIVIPPQSKPLLGVVSFTIDDIKPGMSKSNPVSSLQKGLTASAAPMPKSTSKPTALKPNGALMTPIAEDDKENINAYAIDNVQHLSGADYNPGDSVAVYVDAMRFIPENAGAIKINIKGYTSKLEKNVDDFIMLPRINSTIRMPVYHQKGLIRLDGLHQTTILLASLEVYDLYAKKDKILGYFIINLFIDPKDGRPATQSIIKPKLNEGCYQLPIYCDSNFLQTPFTIERMSKIDNVPAASVLIRLKKSVQDSPADHFEEPLAYSTGAYLTNYYVSSEKDRELMADRHVQPTITIKQYLENWRKAAFVNDELTEEEADEWMKSKMSAAPNAQLFESKFYDLYTEEEGFKIYAVGFHNAPTPLPLGTIGSFNPPGDYYDNPPAKESAFVFTKINMKSPQKSMQYSYEAKIIKGVNPDASWQIILDIRIVQIDSSGTHVIECGWTIFPLFDRSHNGIYPNSGIHMVFLKILIF